MDVMNLPFLDQPSLDLLELCYKFPFEDPKLPKIRSEY